MRRDVGFEWDVGKAEANYRKHGVWFSESLPVFEDDEAITITDDDSDPHEVRFVSIGMGAKERVLVVVYCYRGENIRIISARVAEPHEHSQYEERR
ncbi:MAG: BrnT family toxin [Terracidiphilus sp.]